MDRRHFLAVTGLAGAGTLIPAARPARAQTYPARPVTVLVPFAPGGTGDLSARVLADQARNRRNAPVAVDFRPGAGGTLGVTQVARAAPDGTMLGLYSVSPFGTLPHVQRVPYDAAKDFTYVVAHSYVPIALYVRTDSPLKSWDDLVKFGKDNPGRLRWGTSGVRGAAHIAIEASFRKLGLRATFVPFTGGAEAMTALLGGHIEASVSSDYGPQLQAGQVRLLASTGTEQIAGQPDVPTFKTLDQPLAVEAIYGLVGPAGLPADAVAYWNDVARDMMETPDYRTYLDVVRGGRLLWDHAEFTARAVETYRRLGEAMDSLGFRAR